MNNKNYQEIKTWYQAQKDGKWKELTQVLSQDATVNFQLNNLIKIIYSQFRQQKKLSLNFKPTIEFKGFFGWEDFPNPNKMGHCYSEIKWKVLDKGQKVAGSEACSLSIVLSQKLLLSKLGMSQLITNYEEDAKGVRYEKLEIGFEELIGTISHEIAHAYQFLVNEDEVKSQCESSGGRDEQGKLKYPQLAYEHTALTNEIKTMTVKLPEYQKFKNWWEGKAAAENILPKEVSGLGGESEKNSEISHEANPKAEIGNKKAGQELQSTANEDKWPVWVLPLGIIGGVILFGLMVYLLSRKSKD